MKKSVSFAFVLSVGMILFFSGCGTVAEPSRTLINGDPSLRKEIKSIAVVSFLGEFKLEGNQIPEEKFDEDAPAQRLVESQYRVFLDELEELPGVRVVPHEKVATSKLYERMAINGMRTPVGYYDITCPEGLREIKPDDAFDQDTLGLDLGADGLAMFICGYKWENGSFGKRQAILSGCRLKVFDRSGNILFEQKDVNQPSGMRGGFLMFFGLDDSDSTDSWLVNEATRILVRDFVKVWTSGEE